MLVVVIIHVTARLHNAVPSAIRAGVASGAGTISWLVFLPIALAFGQVSDDHGAHAAGWSLTVLAGLSALLLARGRRQAAGVTVTPPMARGRHRRLVRQT